MKVKTNKENKMETHIKYKKWRQNTTNIKKEKKKKEMKTIIKKWKQLHWKGKYTNNYEKKRNLNK